MINPLDNPIIRLEYLRRFRSGIAAWGIPLLALIPGAAVMIAYQAGTRAVRNEALFGEFGPMMDVEMGNVVGGGGVVGFTPVDPSTRISSAAVSIGQIQDFGLPVGAALIGAAVFVLLILIPAIVGGSVSSERNNDTLQPLQLTALTPTDIVTGKLTASLGYLLLLVTCLAPIMAIPFLVGGLPVLTLLQAFGVLVLVVVELAAVSMMVSSMFRKPVASVIASLVITNALVAGPAVAASLLPFFSQNNANPLDSVDWALRIAALSPMSLFSWLSDVGDVDISEWGTASVRTIALISWAVITAGSLVITRRLVTAPVARDR